MSFLVIDLELLKLLIIKFEIKLQSQLSINLVRQLQIPQIELKIN